MLISQGALILNLRQKFFIRIMIFPKIFHIGNNLSHKKYCMLENWYIKDCFYGYFIRGYCLFSSSFVDCF